MKYKHKIHYALKVIFLLTCLACRPAEILNAGQDTGPLGDSGRSANKGMTYYVGIDGSDTYPGTFEQPLKTLEKAIQIVRPGETIYIRGGTYHCNRTIDINKSGTENKPISILAYKNEKPVFDFSMAWSNGFVIRGAYWYVKGFVIQNAGAAGMVIQSENAHHNTIENITTHSNNNTGLSLRSKAADNMILNCDSHHNFDPVSNGEDADGFEAKFGLGQGNVFKSCRAWNNSDDAFDFWHAGAGVHVEDCYGWDNGRNVWEHPLFQGNSNGFKLGQLEGDHVLIRCVAWDHPNHGFNLNGNSTGVTLHNCTAFRNGINFGFVFTKGNIEKNILRNCLSLDGRVRINSEVDDQYNNWNDSLGVEITKEDFLSLDDSAIKGPRKTDGNLPSSDFLKLAAGSNAIDAGINVGLPFEGSSPDLGAFEISSSGSRITRPESNESPSKDQSTTETSLKNAVEAGQLDAVKRLIEKDPDIHNDFGLLLMTAVSKGHLNVAEYLIDRGASINYSGDSNWRPLHEAASEGHKDMAELLIAKGARVNVKDVGDYTPLNYSIWNADANTAGLLLSKGADLHNRDESGYEPLHWAVFMGSKELTELILSKSQDANVQDAQGFTPLYIAAQYKPEMAETLIDHGAAVDAADKYGAGPLHYAVRYGQNEMAEMLMARGADAGRTDGAGRRALHYAARFGHEDTVKFLLINDTQVNTRDKWGWTPLHLAARGAHKSVAVSLLEAGARTDIADIRGRIPLDMTRSREVAELLRKHSDEKDSSTNIKDTNSDKSYVILERSDVRAVIVNNEPVDDEVLPGHRGGYSGVASLTRQSQDRNLFVPFYAGLNFEHIHDGTNQPRDLLFEPRQAPMQIRRIDEYTAELYQPPTPHWQLESWLRYQLLDDGTIEMTLECIPRARTFKNDYIGLFFASYINKPESLDIHFLGHPADENGAEPQWIRGVTPEHGKLPTHLAVNDNRNFAHDPNFPLTLVFNKSNYRYTEPWYYGVSGGMAFVLMFRPGDNVRLSQSPSGAGNGNPAWDFQWFVPQYKVGHRYRFVMQAMYLPFESRQQIIRATARRRAALERQ